MPSDKTDSTVTPSRLKTDLSGPLLLAYPQGVRTLLTRVPQSERKPDRLGREQSSVINRLHDLQERGIPIHTLDNLVKG